MRIKKPGKSRVSGIHQTTQARRLGLLKREHQSLGEDNNNGMAKADVVELCHLCAANRVHAASRARGSDNVSPHPLSCNSVIATFVMARESHYGQ